MKSDRWTEGARLTPFAPRFSFPAELHREPGSSPGSHRTQGRWLPAAAILAPTWPSAATSSSRPETSLPTTFYQFWLTFPTN